MVGKSERSVWWFALTMVSMSATAPWFDEWMIYRAGSMPFNRRA